MSKITILPLYLVVIFIMGSAHAQTPKQVQGKDDELTTLRSQLEEMRTSFEEMKKDYDVRFKQMQDKISKLDEEKERLEKISKEVVAPVRGGEIKLPSSFQQPPIPEKQPWSPSHPLQIFGAGKSYMNISFDALFDFGTSTSPNVEELERGDHDPKQRGLTLPNEEIFLEGAADPYFKGAADIVYKLDEDNETEIELEEVYMTSLSFPLNLQLKAGQYFTEFGRLNPQHPHQWDFVDQPLVNNRMFGPDGLRSPGGRISWLMPTPFYSEVFLAVLDSQGETAFSFRNEEEDALYGRTPADRGVRSLGDMLFVPRWTSSFDLMDSHTVLLGASAAFGPNATGMDTNTQIYGLDLFWKWKPPTQSGGWPFVTWQTEGMYRRFEAGRDSLAGLPRENLADWGAYSQVIWGFKKRWTAGLRGEFVTGETGNFGDGLRPDRTRLSPVLTFYPSEFTKLRLQYNRDEIQSHGSEDSVFLQLEFSIGAHPAHKF
ncbi:MAG: hypothetical protein HY354_03465 [Planctomycetes bacterium]|nr:hypothetical protein [Planctomycetota bacterium]